MTLSPYRSPAPRSTKRRARAYLPAVIVMLVLLLMPMGMLGLLRGAAPIWRISVAVGWVATVSCLLSLRPRR